MLVWVPHTHTHIHSHTHTHARKYARNARTHARTQDSKDDEDSEDSEDDEDDEESAGGGCHDPLEDVPIAIAVAKGLRRNAPPEKRRKTVNRRQ